MHHLNKKLAVTAAATALLASLGLAVAAQTTDTVDPQATPQQQVDVSAEGPGNHIYFFRDQGSSPETDPAAHLLLIQHRQAVPVAESTTTTTTTVAEATTPADTVTTTMPAASDTSNTDTTAAAPVDTTPALAPKADRN